MAGPGGRMIFQRSISEIAGTSPVGSSGGAVAEDGTTDDANSRMMYRKRNNATNITGEWSRRVEGLEVGWGGVGAVDIGENLRTSLRFLCFLICFMK